MRRSILSKWFIRLRWFAFLGQVAVLALAAFIFRLTLPWELLVGIVLLIPVSNLLAETALTKNISQINLVGGLLALDTIILTAVLFQAGGPMNPFSIVYLLHVVLAAVILTPLWTWTITGLSSAAYALLFFSFRPVPEWHHHGMHEGFSLHLHGMLFAYMAVSVLVAYFLNKIVGELRKKERRLERLENLSANQQRLASLTTITAGAAHELGTPLGTIAIVSHELERALLAQGADHALLEDVALLKSETARCKNVLQELAEKTGDLMGEVPQRVAVADVVTDALEVIAEKERVLLRGATSAEFFLTPRKAVTLALRAIVKNALEASGEKVEVNVEKNGAEIVFVVRDEGEGMDEELLERVGEPFFSTKGQGKGMGLGVYLARLTLEQLGGSVRYASARRQGTTVWLRIPARISAAREAAAA